MSSVDVHTEGLLHARIKFMVAMKTSARKILIKKDTVLGKIFGVENT